MLTKNVSYCIVVLVTSASLLGTESAPVIEAQPAHVSIGFTSSLDVNCSVAVEATSNIAVLFSLFISRSNDSGQTFSDLASISAAQPNTVHLATSEKIIAGGFLDQDGKAYMHLRWEPPTAFQAGDYQCTAQGIDLTGHIMVKNVNAEVTAEDAIPGDIRHKLEQLESYTQRLEQTVVALDNYTKGLESRISEVNAYAMGLEQKISGLENGLGSNVSPVFETEFIFYNRHKYVLSKHTFYDIDISQCVCNGHDGYLAEINDADEDQAIKTFLSNSSVHFGWAVIGGHDRDREGVWVLPSTGEALPFVDWGPYRPYNNTVTNCLGLNSSGSKWQMYDFVCKHERPLGNVRYMCEYMNFRAYAQTTQMYALPL